jgi:hypothetical protein
MIGMRRTLLANAFHRGLSLLTLSGCLSLLGIRLLALYMHLSIESLYPIDLMAMAGILAGVSLQYLPKLLWMLPGFVGAAMAAAYFPQRAESISIAAYTALPFVFIYTWSDMAGRHKAKS